MYTDFANAQSVILVAAGSGITFAASIFEELVGQAVGGKIRTSRINLVWSVFVSCSSSR